MRSKLLSVAMAVSLLAWGAACSKKPADNTQQAQQPAAGQPADNTVQPNSPAGNAPVANAPGASNGSQAPAPAAPQTVTIPKGTIVSVRLGQTISTKTSNSGDQFTATLAEPLVVGDQTIAPSGARATGTVVEAAPLGKFKGGAKLRLSLDAITINGKKISATNVVRSPSGEEQRQAQRSRDRRRRRTWRHHWRYRGRR